MAVNNVTIFASSVALFCVAYLVFLIEDGVYARCISFCFTCGGVYVASKLIPRGRVVPQGRAVFITGCDTGFGHRLACTLDRLGYKVFAGCLSPAGVGANKLRQNCSSNLMIVPCDVTSDIAVNSVKELVKNTLKNEQELYAVVNNAGIWRWSEIEWASVDFYKTLAEVNLYGMVRVTKAFLPMLRQSKGRVVNVGSMGGLLYTNPSNAPYCMTKYAIESYTDSLRYEMHKWNVKAILIEPGEYGVSTAITDYLNGYGDQLWNGMGETARADYGRPYVDAWLCFFKAAIADCYTDSSPVVDAMADAVTSRHPKHRYLVGDLFLTYLETYWFTMLPSWLGDRTFCADADSVAVPAALVKSKRDSLPHEYAVQVCPNQMPPIDYYLYAGAGY